MNVASDIPQLGGSLSIASDGIATCHLPACGWRGIPNRVATKVRERKPYYLGYRCFTVLESIASTECPACETEDYVGEYLEQIAADHAARTLDKRKLGRNDPCWCGSGKKFKRCHG